MLNTYLKTALRTLRRERGYALLNVLGLAVALAACLLIALYLQHELSYDRFHDDADRLYRVVRASEAPGPEVEPGLRGFASLPEGVAGTVDANISGIEALTNFHPSSDELLIRGETALTTDGLYYADSTFFDVLSFELLEGDPRTALQGATNAVLTQSLAARLFGEEDPMGKSFTWVDERSDTRIEYTVAGLMNDPPRASSIRPTAVFSLTPRLRDMRYTTEINWRFFVGGGFAVARLADGTDPSAVQQALATIGNTDEGPEGHLALQPLPSMRLHSNLSNELGPTGDLDRLYLFGVIGLLLLLIAVVNYVNLSTARSAQRAREVGVRKTLGAGRGQVAGQFLLEAVLITLLAVPITIGFARLALPLLEQLTGQVITLAPLWSATGLLLLLGGALLIGLLAGAYPALALSAPHPARVLGGLGTGRSKRGARLRQGLVVFQFAASIVLIVCALVVYHQLHYVQAKSLGFDRAHVVTFSTGIMGDGYDAFKTQLEDDTRLQAVSSGAALGLGRKNMTTSIEDETTGERRWLSVISVDYDYPETMGLSLRAGASFAPERGAENEVLLTERAVSLLDLPENPVGETIQLSEEDVRVAGVVADFHNASLRTDVEPVAFRLQPGNNWTGLARLAPGRTAEGLAALEAAWQAVLPDRPFSYRFLDERIEAQYRSDQRAGRLFGLFAALAVFVAGLGLFGLAAYTAQQRTQEIGIRKVLGASARSIVALLSKDFLKLVAVAFVLAAPIAYYAAHRWLEDFAYRIDIGPGVFLAAGAAAFLAALTTVSYQALRAAWMNPTEAIRNE